MSPSFFALFFTLIIFGISRKEETGKKGLMAVGEPGRRLGNDYAQVGTFPQHDFSVPSRRVIDFDNRHSTSFYERVIGHGVSMGFRWGFDLHRFFRFAKEYSS